MYIVLSVFFNVYIHIIQFHVSYSPFLNTTSMYQVCIFKVHHTSLQSQEEHYVCRHENCRREAYRLVAFASEDELWMHELKAHSTREF